MIHRFIALGMLGIVFYFRNLVPMDERMSDTDSFLAMIIAALYFCTADIIDAINKNK